MSTEISEKTLLPHHEQLPMCTTRLPYRQGRKLTAVKTYTITNESNHLLIFGVPSLNLRQEVKSLFLHFGKLLQFYASDIHPAEKFTETYHARYEKIQSARVAKRMLDTKNFYGGSLHICYAPELETVEETRAKLLQRKKDVAFRLRNLQKDKNLSEKQENNTLQVLEPTENCQKLNMGEVNVIYLDKKRKTTADSSNSRSQRSKDGFLFPETEIAPNVAKRKKIDKEKLKHNVDKPENTIEIVDCTQTGNEVISNIKEALNYKNFGNEVVRKVEQKPLNSIVFYRNKKS